eukprot:7398543-Lingulodinium_polyedra.AAC.1
MTGSSAQRSRWGACCAALARSSGGPSTSRAWQSFRCPSPRCRGATGAGESVLVLSDAGLPRCGSGSWWPAST